MDIGGKIRQLRVDRKMSQQELALQLGISQATMHNIESSNYCKTDFLLMQKVCDIFDKDLSYFANDNIVNNNISENTGQVSCEISCENFTVNNNYPESILTEIQNLINENKSLKERIAALEVKK
jgi:DNA-binding XRE family transcriptional regulator